MVTRVSEGKSPPLLRGKSLWSAPRYTEKRDTQTHTPQLRGTIKVQLKCCGQDLDSHTNTALTPPACSPGFFSVRCASSLTVSSYSCLNLKNAGVKMFE